MVLVIDWCSLLIRFRLLNGLFDGLFSICVSGGCLLIVICSNVFCGNDGCVVVVG